MLRNKRNIAVVSRETTENTRNGQSQNTLDPGMVQEKISRVSEKIEGRVIKKLCKEYSRTESRILGALSELDEIFPNLLVRTCSVAVPGTFRNNDSENREPTGDRSIGDPCPGAVFFACHPSNEDDSEHGETQHMVTRVQEEIPYCSPGTSSRKQKKARSTNQPQLRSENTPATIEADQILLAPQQLATNSKSAKFNNIKRISKLPKSLITMLIFDEKWEKFQLFEDLFQTSLKIHNQLTEEDKINYFHSLMSGDALQTFKNITSFNRENLRETLTVFPRKYVKNQSRDTAKHKFQRLVFLQSSEPVLNRFSGRTPESSERCMGSCR